MTDCEHHDTMRRIRRGRLLIGWFPEHRGIFEALLIFCIILFVFSSAYGQDWERLPLNVGYLDKLIQNPYNPSEIIGYIRSGRFFHSSDGGASWKRIERDSIPLTGAYRDVTMDKNGAFYLLRYSEGLWRSADKGVSWTPLLMLGIGHFHGDSRIRIAEDGSIFVWDGSAQRLHRSTDNGYTWQVIGPADIDYGLDVFVDPRNSDLNAILRLQHIVITTDGGTNWKTYPLPAQARSIIFSRRHEGKLIFRISLGKDSTEFIESCDTGRTWMKSTALPVRLDHGDCNGLIVGEKYFQMNPSTAVYPICRTLQLSEDSGRTFRQITDFRVEDAVCVGEEIIASVPLHGLIHSTDFGETWIPASSQPELFSANEFEFAHASGDTLYVLIGDQEKNDGSTRLLLESNNGGMSWDTLFTTRSSRPRGLAVDARGSTRYYLHSSVPDERYGNPQNRHMVLSGLAGQTTPDTILVTESIQRPSDIYQLETFRVLPSERYPGMLYASRHTNSVGWSTNRGESWEWHAIPISISQVLPWPSQLDPFRLVVTAHEQNPISPYNQSGLYYTHDGGGSFTWVNRDEAFGDRHAKHLYTTKEDRYFLYVPPDSSSLDYGRTWEQTRVGLADGTTHMHNHQSHGETIMQTSTGMYIFTDGKWNLLRDREGYSIWSDEVQARWGGASFIDYTGTHVYIAVPMHGLFRIAISQVTGISANSSFVPMAPQIDLYPNPARSSVNIFWKSNLSSGCFKISIYDTLGRQVFLSQDLPGTGSLTWDGLTSDGTHRLSGIFILHFSGSSGVSVSRTVVLQ